MSSHSPNLGSLRPNADARISKEKTFLGGYEYLRDGSRQRQQKQYFKTLVRRSRSRIKTLQNKER